MDRRRFLHTPGICTLTGFGGCLRLGGNDRTPTPANQDSDDDGVIDSEDYAPRDPDVQRAEQVKRANSTPSESPTETGTPTPSEGGVVEDGFEDGDTSGWTPAAELTSTFEASQDRASSGSWSAEFSEGSASDNPEWERVGETKTPTRVETAHALENGEIYADSFTEWLVDDTVVLRVNYDWSNNFLAVNGSGAEPEDIEDGAVVADLPWPSSDGFFHVALADIDWENSVVGEVSVNGTVQAESVPFFTEADGVDRSTVSIGGNGGNVVFVDDTTVPSG